MNQTYLSVDNWFNLFGQTRIYDYLYMYLQLPICFVAFLLNLITFLVIQKKEFLKSPIYKYMRRYVLNSTLLSLVIMTAFIPGTKRIFQFTNSYGSYFYGCYFYAFLVSTLLLILIEID